LLINPLNNDDNRLLFDQFRRSESNEFLIFAEADSLWS